MLPNVVMTIREEDYEHLDTMWADSAKVVVFPRVREKSCVALRMVDFEGGVEVLGSVHSQVENSEGGFVARRHVFFVCSLFSPSVSRFVCVVLRVEGVWHKVEQFR